MRLDELFSRTAGVNVWTKTGGRLFIDRGQDGKGITVADLTNTIVARKDNGEEAKQDPINS